LAAEKFKMGHVTLTTPLLRVICRPFTTTSYSSSVSKIWSL